MNSRINAVWAKETPILFSFVTLFFDLKYIIETVTGKFVSRRAGHAKWPWLLSLAFVMLPAAFPFVSAKKTVCCVKNA